MAASGECELGCYIDFSQNHHKVVIVRLLGRCGLHSRNAIVGWPSGPRTVRNEGLSGWYDVRLWDGTNIYQPARGPTWLTAGGLISPMASRTNQTYLRPASSSIGVLAYGYCLSWVCPGPDVPGVVCVCNSIPVTSGAKLIVHRIDTPSSGSLHVRRVPYQRPNAGSL